MVESELAINEDLYNSKYKDRLELSYKVFHKLLIYNLRCCRSLMGAWEKEHILIDILI